MKLRTGGFAGAILVIVLCASLTTVRAHQYSAADTARANMSLTRQRTETALAVARGDGVNDSQLAPLQIRIRDILHRREPGGLPFWRPGMAAFYSDQQRSLHAVELTIRRTLRRATSARRSEAIAQLTMLRQAIVAAANLDVDATSASRAASADQTAFAASTLPRQFSAIAGSADRMAVALRAAYGPEQRYVTAELASVHGSREAIRQRAEAEVAAIDARFPMLGLLTDRIIAYGREATADRSSVTVQTSAFRAAVKESHLRRLEETVFADYNRTVPSKMIVVSTEAQSVTAYQDGTAVLTTPATPGGPELPTDHGVFHIYDKISPFVFHSPWPPSSPYYYLPSPVSYWMPFDGGEGLHDAPWRSNFGPGSNVSPTDLGTGNFILGTHGCVNLPTSAAAFIWNWAPMGTTVVVI